jgi:hypothetical protein
MKANKIQHSGLFRRSFAGKLHLAFVLIIIGVLVESCIYPFNPSIDEIQNLLVIDGHIIKGEKVQTIYISRSSVYNEPRFLPETGCFVRVVDDKGKQFSFTETDKGIYTATIPNELIKFNTSYQLLVTTPDNRNYESTPELLLADSPVDSVYYIEEPGQSAATGFMEGVQVYTDLKAEEGAARHYRWVMDETWEYERTYPIEFKYDGLQKRVIQMPINSDNLVVCWKTLPVVGFYSSSTANLKVNEKKRIPLNYVSSNTNRLKIKYSVLVKQYSLSENAYDYFNTKKIETQESGGLYQTQPVQSTSNITNSDDPGEKVLGYFWASSFSQKRIFVKPPFKFFIGVECYPWIPDWAGLAKMEPDINNSFYIVTIDGVMHRAEEKCFDCTKAGGNQKRPDFW